MWQLLEIPLHYLQIDALRKRVPLQFLQKQGMVERLTGNQALRHAQELQIALPPSQADTVILAESAIILRPSAQGRVYRRKS